MVAYSFRPRFVEPIVAGTKRHTIRAHRKRHVRPGEAIQLYCGLRTKDCRKIIPDPICESVMPVRLMFTQGYFNFPSFAVDGVDLEFAEMHRLAIADGFRNLADMESFWIADHGPAPIDFHGVLIKWQAC